MKDTLVPCVMIAMLVAAPVAADCPVFSAPVPSGANWGNALSMTTGDVDGDSDLDLVFWMSYGVCIALNDGTGTFTEGVNVAGMSIPEDLHLADLDGDGLEDIVACGFDNHVYVAIASGGGAFGAVTTYVVGDPAVLARIMHEPNRPADEPAA